MTDAKHTGTGIQISEKILLVGSPNVGKGALFNSLSGGRVSVSIYPGTSVDVFTGKMRIGRHHQFTLIDTPGKYALKPAIPEEEVTRSLVLGRRTDLIIHIIDAKNLERHLPLTFQLIETGRSVILVLNHYDSLSVRTMELDIAHLEHDIGIPVVETVSTRGHGAKNLASRIVEVIEGRYNFKAVARRYSPALENRIAAVMGRLEGKYPLSKRAIAILALLKDKAVLDMLEKSGGIRRIKSQLKSGKGKTAAQRLTQERKDQARDIIYEAAFLHLDTAQNDIDLDSDSPPRTAYICDCLKISEKQVRDAVRKKSLRSLQDVIRYTEAGDGCMTCHPALQQVIEAETKKPMPLRRKRPGMPPAQA